MDNFQRAVVSFLDDTTEHSASGLATLITFCTSLMPLLQPKKKASPPCLWKPQTSTSLEFSRNTTSSREPPLASLCPCNDVPIVALLCPSGLPQQTAGPLITRPACLHLTLRPGFSTSLYSQVSKGRGTKFCHNVARSFTRAGSTGSTGPRQSERELSGLSEDIASSPQKIPTPQTPGTSTVSPHLMLAARTGTLSISKARALKG